MQPRDPGNPAPRKTSAKRRRVRGGLLGLGLDGDDGHKRVTKGDDFVLLGGSAETHERMQELVMRMNENLRRRGKQFGDLSSREFEDLARDALK